MAKSIAELIETVLNFYDEGLPLGEAVDRTLNMSSEEQNKPFITNEKRGAE